MVAHRDIVIAGGGMVGLSLALQLGQALSADLSISLVESFPFPDPSAQRPDYHPSFDARSTALSYSSRLIYEKSGLWPALQQWLCSIETIHVSTKGRFGSALLAAADYHWPALGYVVENAWLGRVLLQAVQDQGRVELISPARVVVAEPCPDGVRLQLAGCDDRSLESRLLVVADGGGSGLRDQLGVTVEKKCYGQHALIANIGSARTHGGCAFERFTDQGPLALLPLPPARDGQYRSALVWTLAPEQAEHLLGCPEDEFLTILQQRFGYRLGRLQQVGERNSYPLQLSQAAEQVRRGIVVMGNAAHALHPVAGQGFNLALRDVNTLVDELAAALSAGHSPGDLGSLQDYQRRARPDQRRTVAFSDRLPGLFMSEDPLLAVTRDLALSGLDFLPPLKREFVRYAAGVNGSV